jgi:POT family proton-dependent oligopeptide transporter
MTKSNDKSFPKSFWVVWGVEFWERFGYYGVQAIIALYFVHHLGYTQKESFYIFGSFSAFVYGFVWLGGWIGDHYLGAKRTLLLGASILTLSYAALALSTKGTVFYALAAVVVGNALFKANPSSLIAKIYNKDTGKLDGAMTMYYMAINLGSITSMVLTPILAQSYGWPIAFALCSFGMAIGLMNYLVFNHHLAELTTPAGKVPLCLKKLSVTILGAVIGIVVIAHILSHIMLATIIVYTVVTVSLMYFLKIAFSLQGRERARMLIAFFLILEGILFFVMYNQMPTSLTFFAVHNINNHVLGMNITPAEYQVLNPVVIVIMSPILAWVYRRWESTHVTKFCAGMTLCAFAFLVLGIPQYTSTTGLASPLWLVLTYFLQSTGELLISGLGLAMVASLCPKERTGFVMGVWFLGAMLAGPLGAAVGALSSPPTGVTLTAAQSIVVYGHVFVLLGSITLTITAFMWATRPWFNKYIKD